VFIVEFDAEHRSSQNSDHFSLNLDVVFHEIPYFKRRPEKGVPFGPAEVGKLTIQFALTSRFSQGTCRDH
jgi:hypothetical protein